MALFIGGLFVGTALGILVMCLLIMAREPRG